MERKEYISDEDVVKRANAAVRIELEKKKALGIPAVVFDRKTRTILSYDMRAFILKESSLKGKRCKYHVRKKRGILCSLCIYT